MKNIILKVYQKLKSQKNTCFRRKIASSLRKPHQNLNSFAAHRSEFFENPSFKRPVREAMKPKFENFHLGKTLKIIEFFKEMHENA